MTKMDIIHELHKQADLTKRPLLDICLEHLLQCKLIIVGDVPPGAYANREVALISSKMGICTDASEYDEDRRYR